MYHFVKIKNIWYLKIEKEQDIIDHLHTIMKREFELGWEDWKNGTYTGSPLNGGKTYHAHPTTPWNCAVTMYLNLFGGTWFEAADKLEKKTIEDRIKFFKKGNSLYLQNNLTYMSFKDDQEITDEKFSKELIYPIEAQYHFDDVRYIQWPDGKHWYAKVGNLDICDKEGNYKWNTKEEAMNAAKKFCNSLVFNKMIR